MPIIDYFRNAKEFTTYLAGETIFQAGEPDESMYAVKEGEVEILFNGRVLETVGAGGILGEKSLVDGSPHTTTAVAKTDCQIVPVDEHRFLFLVQETPTFALQVMRVMAERTRHIMQMAIAG